MSLQEFPASTYPKSIFEPRKPDETQSLGGDPTFNVLLKGYKTRSVIYERMLPDNVSTALKIQGPRGSNSTAIFKGASAPFFLLITLYCRCKLKIVLN